MNQLPEPLRSILRDYCHVEWFELDELAEDVRTARQKFDADSFRKQLLELISGKSQIACELNILTANEFESDDQARAWLLLILSKVFP